jgi:hypothetical protein
MRDSAAPGHPARASVVVRKSPQFLALTGDEMAMQMLPAEATGRSLSRRCCRPRRRVEDWAPWLRRWRRSKRSCARSSTSSSSTSPVRRLPTLLTGSSARTPGLTGRPLRARLTRRGVSGRPLTFRPPQRGGGRRSARAAARRSRSATSRRVALNAGSVERTTTVSCLPGASGAPRARTGAPRRRSRGYRRHRRPDLRPARPPSGGRLPTAGARHRHP